MQAHSTIPEILRIPPRQAHRLLSAPPAQERRDPPPCRMH